MTIMYFDEVRTILIDVLALGESAQHLSEDSPLLGSPIDDDDISASTFATLGTLAAFVAQKQAE
jgi:acyl carrier protein